MWHLSGDQYHLQSTLPSHAVGVLAVKGSTIRWRSIGTAFMPRRWRWRSQWPAIHRRQLLEKLPVCGTACRLSHPATNKKKIEEARRNFLRAHHPNAPASSTSSHRGSSILFAYVLRSFPWVAEFAPWCRRHLAAGFACTLAQNGPRPPESSPSRCSQSRYCFVFSALPGPARNKGLVSNFWKGRRKVFLSFSKIIPTKRLVRCVAEVREHLNVYRGR